MFIYRNYRVRKRLICVLALLAVLLVIIGRLVAFFSDAGVLKATEATAGTVTLKTTVATTYNGVTVDGSTVSLSELNGGDVLNLAIAVENQGNKSAWLAVELALKGTAINQLATTGGTDKVAELMKVISIYPGTLSESEAQAEYANNADDPTRFRGPIVDSTNYQFAWSHTTNQVLNGNHALADYEDETAVFGTGGAMASSGVTLMKDGVNANTGTLNYTLYYHPDTTAETLLENKSLSLSVDSYGVQYRNNPNHGMATWDYGYTGAYQTFIAPEDGLYRFEAWGAQGGAAEHSSTVYDNGGSGGYVSGDIGLKKNQMIYIWVGNKPDATNGTSGLSGEVTDFRLVSGVYDEVVSLNSRLAVAAGGGGAAYDGNGNRITSGGAGGGLEGLLGTTNGSITQGRAGTQTAGGAGVTGGAYTSQAGSFGKGSASSNGNGGYGGNGWYGGSGSARGTMAQGSAGGGGGSSFISGHIGCIALSDTSASNNTNPRSHKADSGDIATATQTINGVDYVFAKTKMLAGNTASPSWQYPNWDGTTAVGNAGHGHARVTKLD